MNRTIEEGTPFYFGQRTRHVGDLSSPTVGKLDEETKPLTHWFNGACCPQ